ncbi:MOFRL family protein, partial [Thermococcus sp.]
VISLILSDVVGDRLEAIASGPTVKDPTTFQDTYRILKLYNVWEKLPESVKKHIERGLRGEAEETLKEDLPNVHNFIVGSGRIACERAKKKAEELGYNAVILTTTLEGEAREVALVIGSIVQEVSKYDRPVRKPAVLIAGGEWTVTITGGAGLGGPNQELALSVARKIVGLNAVVLAVDTDGTDGPTDAAGGIVDGETLERLKEAGIDVEEVLKRHDAYRALEKVGALLRTGPTGTNVNSLVIAVALSTPSKGR